jgi:organic hydroperoxide reductase OsmC/OhrA
MTGHLNSRCSAKSIPQGQQAEAKEDADYSFTAAYSSCFLLAYSVKFLIVCQGALKMLLNFKV